MTTETMRRVLDRPLKTRFEPRRAGAAPRHARLEGSAGSSTASPGGPRPSGRTLFPALLLAAALLAVPWAATPALDMGGYSMEILVDGRTVDELSHDGTTYIEAARGREYSIRLRNYTGERIAVALSVDGLNSIDARTTTARQARKWILEPWQTLTLDGWQTSSSTARRFFFTTEEDSYGAWLGRARNLGTIAAVVFRERRPFPQPVPYALEQGSRDKDGASRRQDAPSSAGSPAAPAPSGSSRSGANGEADRLAGAAGHEAETKSALSDELAATGIGRELSHQVRRVEFDAEAQPSAVLQIRYEYRDALVRLGVLPPRCGSHDPLARRERSRGFEDLGYAPDPYRHRR